jgi:hypothetical protein
LLLLRLLMLLLATPLLPRPLLPLLRLLRMSSQLLPLPRGTNNADSRLIHRIKSSTNSSSHGNNSRSQCSGRSKR